MVNLFISHSKKDAELVKIIGLNFRSMGVTPLFMEFTPESEPPYAKIQEKVKISDAVFLFLTENVVSSIYTTNWISFEVGLTKQANKPLFLVEDGNKKVHFPVPYVSSYILYEPHKIGDWQTIQQILINIKQIIENKKLLTGLTIGGALIGTILDKKSRSRGALIGSFTGLFLGGFLTSLNQAAKVKSIKVLCPKCKIHFDYYSTFIKFPCPACRTELKFTYPVRG